MRRRRRAACRGRRPGCRARFGGGRRRLRRIARRRVRRSSRRRRHRGARQTDRQLVRDRRRMRERLLRRRRLLQQRLHRHLRDVRRSGHRRDLRRRPARNRSARRVRRSRRRRRCGSTGMCDGTGACDKYPAGHRLQGDGVHRVDADVGVPLRRQRHLRVDARPDVRAVQLRDRQPLPDDLHRRHRLPGPQQLHQRQLRQEADRRRLRRRPRMQLRLLRAGRLLRRRLPGHLSFVRGAGQHRHLHQRSRRRRSAGPVRRPGRGHLRQRRHVRRQGGLPAVRLGNAVRGAGLHGCHRHPARPLQRHRHVHARHAAGVRVRIPAGPPARAAPRAPPTPTARAATSATGRSAARRSTASTAPPATECASGSCQQGVCCAGACTGHLHVVRADRQPRRLHADPRQHRSAEPVRRRRVVQLRHRRVSATARAPAGCMPPGIACGSAVVHADRRSRWPGAATARATAWRARAQPCTPYVCGGDELPRHLRDHRPSAPAETSARRRAAACKPLGAACAAGGECDSGICAQGVCCRTACTATCMSCALTGTGGHLLDRARGQRSAEPVQRSGRRQLRHRRDLRRQPAAAVCYASGTTCVRGATCTHRQLHAGADVQRHRRLPGAEPPSPAAPTTAARAAPASTTCATNADCAAPNVCIAGQCAKKLLGTACASGGECASGPVPAGRLLQLELHGHVPLVRAGGQRRHLRVGPRRTADPLSQCTDNGATSCGTDGMCDGAGGCRLYAAGTMCAAATCTGVDVHARAHVQRHRKLPRGRRSRPAIRTCAAPSGACRTSCADVRRVHAPNTCTGGQLRQEADRRRPAPRPPSATRTCANRASAARPRAPASAGRARWPGTLGTCTSVAAGADPLNQCTDQGAAGCGTDGTCDGSGACRLYATRDDLRRVDLQRHDRSRPRAPATAPGTCGTVTATDCGAYMCGDGRDVPDDLHGRRRLRGAQRLHRRKLRQAPQRRGVHGGGRVLEQFLRAGDLLPDGLHGELPLVRDDRRRRARARWWRRAQIRSGQCADSGAATCGADGFCDGGGACRLYASGTVVRRRELQRARRSRPRGPATAPAPVRRRRRRRAAHTPARPASAGRRARPTRDCAAPNVCVDGRVHQEADRRGVRRRRRVHDQPVRSRGSAARAPAPGPASRAPSPARWAPAPTSPPGQDPLNQCTDQAPRQLRQRRLLRRRRRLPALRRRGRRAAAATLHRLDADRGARRATAPAPARRRRRRCATLTRAARRRCRTTCTVNARLRGAVHLHRRQLRPEAGGRRLRAPAANASRASARRASAATRACGGTCQSCALAGHRRGRAPTCAAGAGSAEPVRRSRRRQLQHRRHVQRRRRVPPVRARARSARRATCTGSTVTPARTCNGTGTCQTATTSSCAPYACGTGACRTTCTTSADCASPNICVGGSCGLKPVGAACAGTAVQLGELRPGRLLRRPLHGHLPLVRDRRDAGDLRERAERAGSADQCTDAGVATAAPTGLQRRRRAAACTSRGRPAWRRRARDRRSRPPRTCNGTGTCQAATSIQLHAVSSAAPEACRTTCTVDGDCVAPNICSGRRVHQASQRRHLHRGRRLREQRLRAGRLLRDACARRPASRARSPAPWGRARTSPPGGSAEPVHRRGRPSCGNDGTCNGAGACRLYVTGTQCVAPACTARRPRPRGPATAAAPARPCRRRAATPTRADGRVPHVLHEQRRLHRRPTSASAAPARRTPT